MTEANFFAFDPAKFSELFKSADMTKFFEGAKVPGFDMEALFAAQQKNMEALVEANKTAAAGYQDLFKKQMSMIDETVAAAQAQMSELKMDSLTADSAAKQGELMKDAYEKAVANLTELAETAKKVNEEALEIIQARVQAAMAELKELGVKGAA
ncbi:phasin family protein [Rhodovulum sp. DZ06]|uniref:phasin family protein n=1 Tax=Rhodovulum sp. DZ06 TaxID=3425126 RepID=UPI003D343C69